VKAVDLFAGWGGFSEGARIAGLNVVWAANHWPLAVEAHAVNHPEAHHECQDLRQADWTSLPKFDVLLAAPACQGHSAASRPRRRLYHDAMRATAWSVIDCAEVTEPRAIVVENVLQFRQWQLFPLWREALVKLGYHVADHELCASDYGVPQRRRRLFITATRKALPVRLNATGKEPAFGPCIESISSGWRFIADTSDGVRERIDRGRHRCGKRFLSQHVTGHSGVPLTEPIRTITTQDHWILVDGDRYRPLTIRELARGMGFPERYQWPATASRTDCIMGLGNAVPPPLAAHAIGAVL
jgi:DNA (cytosine-5)-methyltransferase 1